MHMSKKKKIKHHLKNHNANQRKITCAANSGFGERNIVHIFVREGSSSPDPYMEILLEVTLEM